MQVCAWGYLGVHSAEQNFVVHFAVRYQILTKHMHTVHSLKYMSIYIFIHLYLPLKYSTYPWFTHLRFSFSPFMQLCDSAPLCEDWAFQNKNLLWETLLRLKNARNFWTWSCSSLFAQKKNQKYNNTDLSERVFEPMM